jgi:uncharacterized protein (TIGR02271 family)
VQLRNGASVRSPDGVLGVIEARRDDPPGRVTLRLSNGREALLPEELLTPETDGTYRTTVTLAQLLGAASAGSNSDDPGDLAIPVIAEDLQVSKRQVAEGTLRVNKTVHERTEVVQMPLSKDRLDVRRVVLDRDVDGPHPVRYEGDTLIVPVFEEVLVVQKKLRLKEELHITRKTVVENYEENVTLQREEASLERVDKEGNVTEVETPARRVEQTQPISSGARRRSRGPFLTED